MPLGKCRCNGACMADPVSAQICHEDRVESGKAKSNGKRASRKGAAAKTEDRKVNMSAHNDAIYTAGDTKEAVLAAATRGGQTAAADEAGELILDVAYKLLGESEAPEILSDPNRIALVKFVLAAAIHHGSGKFDIFPCGSGVQTACGLVMEATFRDFIQPRMEGIRAALGGLERVGEIGAKTAAAEAEAEAADKGGKKKG